MTSASGRKAFITPPGAYNPSTGLAGADAVCAARATAASLSGTFKAFLATSSASALSRFDVTMGSAPWVRVDGVQVVQNAADLASGNLLAPINVEADKSNYQGNSAVFTGASSPTSNAAAGQNCNDWSSNSASDSVAGGKAMAANPEFFYYIDGYNCDGTYLSMYCLEQ